MTPTQAVAALAATLAAIYGLGRCWRLAIELMRGD